MKISSIRFNRYYLNLPILIISLILLEGCTKYVNKAEFQQLERLKYEVYLLEKEVKELKEKQIKLIHLKNQIERQLENCDRIREIQDSTRKNN